MPKRAYLPLNNPLSQKSEAIAIQRASASGKEVTGVCQGGEGEKPVIYMLLRCRQCNREQQLVFQYWKVPKWHRCVGCGDLQPTQGFALITHANFPLG